MTFLRFRIQTLIPIILILSFTEDIFCIKNFQNENISSLNDPTSKYVSEIEEH